jgi:type II secretory ATPase GspE/PulE/Tfp pilus assembly ATPase PilB-like protein
MDFFFPLGTEYSVLGTPYPVLGTLFPRGPGFYFNLAELVPVVAVYLTWARACWWVDRDARAVGLPATRWGLLLLGGGLLGLLGVGALPWFPLSFALLLALVAAPLLVYVHVHNLNVPEGDRLLTEGHLRRLLRLAPARKPEPEAGRRPAVRFLPRGEEDTGRAARAGGPRGYEVAQALVREAVEHRATDVHLEPGKGGLAVRYRVDGVLQAGEALPRPEAGAVITALKALAGLDTAEKRKPQEGAFSAQVGGQAVDFRVSTSGTIAGEKLLLRVCDRSHQLVDLADLGMPDRLREQVRELVTRPRGLFVVCGPPGSGRRTTVHACLGEFDHYQKHVVTLEEPIECPVAHVKQIEVDTRAGRTFAAELRGVLIQSPDAVCLGEVRDAETAAAAAQAARETLLLAALQAPDTTAALARLAEFGVTPAALAEVLVAVLAQRLVRVLCPECKVRYRPDPETLRKANLPADRIKHFYKPRADGDGTPAAPPCPHCGGSGYHGRTGIFELLIVTDRVRELLRGGNWGAVKQEAVKGGMRYLQEDGLRQVIDGQTSIQELLRVSR